MKVSTKGRYGLRAMVELASNQGGYTSLKNISARQGISERYLEQLIAPLKKAGFVASVRGSQGGYTLQRPADEVTVGDILRALEKDLIPTDCSGVNPNIECTFEGCATKVVWQKMADSINKVVDSITLLDIITGNVK